jgi:ATP-dependent Lhr-like helicase
MRGRHLGKEKANAIKSTMHTPPELAWAHPITAEWFLHKFGSPTEPQIQGWPSILAGSPTLISAPTGSGKTLAAFLVCIDKLLRQSIEGSLLPSTQVVYVSPLKALSNDVQKNLDGPLAEIQRLALERGFLSAEIRIGVRTGDTLPSERAAMLRKPPHILVTTPESLYILLTAARSRQNLHHVHTVIVDEIHAMADDKRGAHLALSLERLEALVRGENRLSPGFCLNGFLAAPQRIGLSATQNPIGLVAQYLTGGDPGRPAATIVQVGQQRELDLAIEVPSDELSSVTSTVMWEEIFDKLAAHAQNHRSTLVFVNTRKLVEKVAFALGERLGVEDVAAHHGSLSRALRLDAEQRLKKGAIKILVATASLELGIDIGDVDLVCQIASTRAVAVAMQRVGRAGHWRGAVPKGRFFATTRDDLVEQAALVRKIRAGQLDVLEIPPQPMDVLMQQIVAACGAESWEAEALFQVFRRAWSYRNLSREQFDELVGLLSNGIEARRGRYGAYLMLDAVYGRLHARRGARMVAIANGGAIPDNALFQVILRPEDVQIATLDEHFAVDSSPGDVILLGNSSWRVQRIESAGRVLVEDAHGAPPSVPFWTGEAPQRTSVLCDGVSELREQLSERTPCVSPDSVSSSQPQVAETIKWLTKECCVCTSGALQLINYIVAGRAVLGAVPTKKTIIAERFFDEGGGMQLILHAPFGGRINKAWGLALRKRFCRGFNFELQAAATDNGINISLAEQHSFALMDVFQFLNEQTVKELLEQAAIASPIFKARWRWAAARSLQLLRFSNGKRIAPQVQRTRSEDLMASVFPQAAACFETIVGDIQIPAHPLVGEVMQDVLQEAMDLDGLRDVLRHIQDGGIRCIAVDTPVPSVFAHELVNANPYAFLDEAGLEERRARAVSLRGAIPPSVLEQSGRLDQRAIKTVREQCWPDLRNEHELHDLLLNLVAFPISQLREQDALAWTSWCQELQNTGRAGTLMCAGSPSWVAAERLSVAKAIWPAQNERNTEPAIEIAVDKAVRGWLQILGPVTANELATLLGIDAARVDRTFLEMEVQGLLLRGSFERPATTEQFEIEWCERRILQRIHQLTRNTLRKQVEAVTPAVFMRWVLAWQHLAPQCHLTGEQGLFQVLLQLEGFEAPAIEWERSILPARVVDYNSQWLDQLCLSGTVGWGRISPHPAWSAGDGAAPTRVIPSNSAPITFYIRDSADWLPHALAEQGVEESKLQQALSEAAVRVRHYLQQRGACFTEEIERALCLTRSETLEALWELATAGLATADGFDQLRAMIDPVRRPAIRNGYRKIRSTAGRWSLFQREIPDRMSEIGQARHTDLALEAAAHTLLARYGIVFRDLVLRESNLPKWRDLVGMFRRLEDRGIVRGGRFVSGFGGEQFASPEALESLRASRHTVSEDIINVAGGDPMNLAGIVLPGARVPAIPGRCIQFRNGLIFSEQEAVSAPQSQQTRHVRVSTPPPQLGDQRLGDQPRPRKTVKTNSLPLFEGLEIASN